MVHRVQVQLHWLLLFLGVALEHVSLRLDHLQDRLLFAPQPRQQGDVGVLLCVVADVQDVVVDAAEVGLCWGGFGWAVGFHFFVGFGHVG